MGTVYKSDVGTVIELSIGQDLSSATDQKIKVKKLTGVKLDWSAAVKSPPTEGIIQHTVASEELDEVGYWYLASYVEFGANKFIGQTVSLEVEEVLE